MAAYTNNNQTILLNTLISEFIVIDNPLKEKNENVQGLCLLDTHLVIYGQYSWVVFNMAGKEIKNKRVLRENPILLIKMESLDDYSIIYWSGEESRYMFI